jgi:hypothetical protein
MRKWRSSWTLSAAGSSPTAETEAQARRIANEVALRINVPTDKASKCCAAFECASANFCPKATSIHSRTDSPGKRFIGGWYEVANPI